MKLPRTVYALYIPSTGKRYIGSTSRPRARLQAHLSALERGKHHVQGLQEDFDLSGGNVNFEVLDIIEDFAERDKEYEWMAKFNTTDPAQGYNYLDQIALKKVAHMREAPEPLKLIRQELPALRTIIKEAVDQTADVDLLDLVFKLLVQ